MSNSARVSRRVARGLVSVVVAAGLAAGSAVLTTDWLHDRRAEQVAAQAEPLQPESRVDRVANALAGLADDGVYVAPDARDLLDRRGEQRVARAVAASPTTVRVVVWSKTRFAGASGYDLIQQLEAGLEESGETGVYFIWDGPASGYAEPFGAPGYLRDLSPRDDFVGDPATTLPRLVAQVHDDVNWIEPVPEAESDYWGGRDGGIIAGMLIGIAVLAGLGVLYGIVVVATKRRLPGTWRW